MTAAAELLRRGAAEVGIPLDPRMEERFLLLLAELRKWSARINLTALRSDADIVVKHFLDSLTVSPLVPHGTALLDVGSGAGFPGIPLKIVRDDLTLYSVDAVEKKIAFQRHVVRLLQLEGVEARHARLEGLAAERPEAFDCAVSRAFSEIPLFVDLALPLVRPGGLLLAMKGKSGEEETAAAQPHLQARRVSVEEVRSLALPVSGDTRTIIVLRKG